MRYSRLLQNFLALVAILFGVVTVFAGARVLLGADPGYVVFRPLLIYNTAMGFAYFAAGVLAWRSLIQGRQAAAAISMLNLLVLAAIGALFVTGGAVAVESVRAMTLRSVVWLALLVGLAWLGHKNTHAE